jgi:hypothetical protein
MIRHSNLTIRAHIAVERSVTQPPPHRSRRAVFPHRALQKYSLPQSSLDQLNLSRLGLPYNPWLLYPVVLQQLSKAAPVVASSLTSSIQPFE